MTGYVIKFEGNTTEISNKQLLKKYNEIWKRVEKLLKVKFDSEPVCDDNDQYIKTKIKIYVGSMITNFHSKKFQNKKRDASVYQYSCWILLSKQRKSIIIKHSQKNANVDKKR